MHQPHVQSLSHSSLYFSASSVSSSDSVSVTVLGLAVYSPLSCTGPAGGRPSELLLVQPKGTGVAICEATYTVQPCCNPSAFCQT